MFRWMRRRRAGATEDIAALIAGISALLREQQSISRDILQVLKGVDADARQAKAECRVLSHVVACLLAHVADELSGPQTLDVVLGEVEQVVDEAERESGDASPYRDIIRRLRRSAELRRPKPP